MQRVILEIDKYSKIHRKASDIVGAVENDREYQLIVEANNLAVEIDTEIGKNFNSYPHSLMKINFYTWFLKIMCLISVFQQ